jgi:acetylornithine/N-succinyldiaminopimelate aminotransferase
MNNVHHQGEILQDYLKELNRSLGLFAEIRGRGLMIGAVLTGEWQGRAAELTEQCRHHGVLILQAGPNVLRFLPPLTITAEELETGMARVAAALHAAKDGKGPP